MRKYNIILKKKYSYFRLSCQKDKISPIISMSAFYTPY